MASINKEAPVEGLLPGLSDDLVLTEIVPRLPWYTRACLLAVSRPWNAAFNDPANLDVLRRQTSPPRGVFAFDHRRIVFYDVDEERFREVPCPPLEEIDGSTAAVSAYGWLVMVQRLDKPAADPRMIYVNIHALNIGAGECKWQKITTLSSLHPGKGRRYSFVYDFKANTCWEHPDDNREGLLWTRGALKSAYQSNEDLATQTMEQKLLISVCFDLDAVGLSYGGGMRYVGGGVSCKLWVESEREEIDTASAVLRTRERGFLSPENEETGVLVLELDPSKRLEDFVIARRSDGSHVCFALASNEGLLRCDLSLSNAFRRSMQRINVPHELYKMRLCLLEYEPDIQLLPAGELLSHEFCFHLLSRLVSRYL